MGKSWFEKIFAVSFETLGAPHWRSCATKAADPEPKPEDPVERIVGSDMDGGMTVDGEPTGLIGQVQIEFVEGLGVFIVKGQKADVEKVIKLIEQIDAMTGDTQPTILIHPLKHVNSVVLSELIEELYDDVFGTRLSPVNITPLDKPNALLLIGREESMASILDLIEKLDQPVPPATQLKVFQLKYMSAIDAETQVRDFFSDEPSVYRTQMICWTIRFDVFHPNNMTKICCFSH